MDSPNVDPRVAQPRRSPPPVRSTQPDDCAVDGLLSAAGHGDLKALAAFLDQTAPAVFGLLRGVLGEHAAAEEATERVYLHLWHVAPRFDPHRGCAWSLLLRTARRELIDHTCTLIAATPGPGAGTSPPEPA